MKTTVTQINGHAGSWDAYGPFPARNETEWYLVQCGHNFGFEHAFMVCDGVAWDPANVWTWGKEPAVHYAFAMACADLLEKVEAANKGEAVTA